MGIPDVPNFNNMPGGAFRNVLNQLNEFENNKYLKSYNKTKAQYAPTTMQAEAASKLAYANLMAPQFIAKAMNNPAFMANLTEEQKNAMRDMVNSAGTNAPNINSLNQMPQNTGIGEPSTNSFSGRVKNAFHALTGQMPQQPQMQNSNAMARPMLLPRQNGNVLQNTMPQQQDNPQALQAGSPATFADENGNNQIALQAYDKWMKSPVGKAEIAKGENGTIPNEQEVVQWAAQQTSPSMSMDMTGGQRAPHQPTWSENTGTQKGIENELAASGGIRAKAMDELDQQYQQALQSEVPLKHMNEIVTNPIFQNMRQFPWFQNMQLNAKAKMGTPEEQKLVGDFQTTALKSVAETVMGFKGRILDKEVSLANDMKVSKDDTMNVILGKLPTIEAFNEMTKQRSRLASQLMGQKHIGRSEALEQADKMIDGKAIRAAVEDELSPKVTIRNSKTGETKTISAAEARKLGVPNV